MPNHATPTPVKLAQGNPSGRPINDKEPPSIHGEPPIPFQLSPQAESIWRDIIPVLRTMRTLNMNDGIALAALCNQLALYQNAVADYTTNGMVIKSSQGLKKNPSVTIADAALKQIRALLGEFGLTPASRTRIQSDHPDLESPLERLLSARPQAKGYGAN